MIKIFGTIGIISIAIFMFTCKKFGVKKSIIISCLAFLLIFLLFLAIILISGDKPYS